MTDNKDIPDWVPDELAVAYQVFLDQGIEPKKELPPKFTIDYDRSAKTHILKALKKQ